MSERRLSCLPDITFRGVTMYRSLVHTVDNFSYEKEILCRRGPLAARKKIDEEMFRICLSPIEDIYWYQMTFPLKRREDLSETHHLAGSKKIEEVIFRLCLFRIEELYRLQTTFPLKTEEKSSKRPSCHHQDNRKGDFRTFSVTDCGSLSIPYDVSAQNGREILYRREGRSFGCTVAAPAPGQTLIAVICGQ